MTYSGELVMPAGYVEVAEEEMMYLDGGGIYLSNARLKSMTVAFFAAWNTNARLVAAGITLVATTVSRVVSRITSWIGSVCGGAVGSFVGWAIGAFCGWNFGLAYYNAMTKGKGIDIGVSGFKVR